MRPRLFECRALVEVAGVLFFLQCMLSIVACSNTDTARWTEDVWTHDGRLFQLEARATRMKRGSPTEHRGPIQQVEYFHRHSNAYWRAPYHYRPVIWDIVDGAPVVVVLADHKSKCFLHDFPAESVLVYRWTSTGWQETTLARMPAESMKFNLLVNIFDRTDPTKDAAGFVSTADKGMRDGPKTGLSSWLRQSGASCQRFRGELGAGLRYETYRTKLTFSGLHGKPTFD